MHWLIAFIAFLLLFQPLNIEPIVMPWVAPVHNACLVSAPKTEFRDWYRAIVCGENLPASIEKSWFQRTGLIHVIVVSGSHLIFLEQLLLLILGTGRRAVCLQWMALLLFSAASNLQPPITRALVQKFCGHGLKRQRIGMRAMHVQFISGLVTLAFFPGWWTSLSFLMSWFCSLALSLPIRSQFLFWRPMLIYFILFPAILNIQSPHPASILFNAFFAPVLGFVLFPMCLVAFLHPICGNACDVVWRVLFHALSELPIPESEMGTRFSVGWLTVYLGSVQAAGFIYVIRSRRKQWNESLSLS